MIKIETTDKGAGVVVEGTSDVILSELALAIRVARERIKEKLPWLDADNLIREAIRMGMMSGEDFDEILDDQRKKILWGRIKPRW